MQTLTSLSIPIFDFVLCLSEAVDLISSEVADHHKRTAQICYGLGRQLGLSENDLRDLTVAAALHDVGGLTRADRLSALDFEYQDPFGHAVMGYLLLKPFLPFEKIADIVRFHHVPWQNGEGSTFEGEEVPVLSHLLQLADRVAVSIDVKKDVLLQATDIIELVSQQADTRFMPQYVQALKDLQNKESFWLDAVYLKDLNSIGKNLKFEEIQLTEEDFLGITNVFRRIIDFRSVFTATHSAGVAATSRVLARLLNFTENDQRLIYLAGLLHDLGKLAVPSEVLEKPGKLTVEEFDQIKKHTYYTFHILESLKILDVIRVWGAFHHERLDGNGYPFHIPEGEIPLGSRVVAVADIFTALTEDRPYRSGMTGAEALAIITDLGGKHNIDQQVTKILQENIQLIDQERRTAQKNAVDEYDWFLTMSKLLTPSVS